ncbi:hypothetical protein D6833_02195, partial [Candidatus Parcubacteria bacterium]
SNGELDESPDHLYEHGFFAITAKFLGDPSASTMFPHRKEHVVITRTMSTTSPSVLHRQVQLSYTYPNFGPSADVMDRTTVVTGPRDLLGSPPTDWYQKRFQYFVEPALRGRLEKSVVTDFRSSKQTISEATWDIVPLFQGYGQVPVLVSQRTYTDGIWTREDYDLNRVIPIYYDFENEAARLVSQFCSSTYFISICLRRKITATSPFALIFFVS